MAHSAPRLNVRNELSKDLSRELITNMLPERFRPHIGKFISRASLTIATSKNKDKLMRCTSASIVQAVCQAAEYGFAIDDKFCYAIPYGDVCTAMFDYKAIIAVARRHNQIADARAAEIRENDKWTMRDEDGRQRYVYEKCCRGDRGPVEGAYCVITLPNGITRVEHMTAEDLVAIRASSKSPDSPAWRNYPDQMHCKAVLKRALKTVQDDPVLSSLIEYDNQLYDMDKIIDSPSTQVRSLDDLGKEIMGDSGRIESHSDPVNEVGMSAEEVAEVYRREAEESAENSR